MDYLFWATMIVIAFSPIFLFGRDLPTLYWLSAAGFASVWSFGRKIILKIEGLVSRFGFSKRYAERIYAPLFLSGFFWAATFGWTRSSQYLIELLVFSSGAFLIALFLTTKDE